MALLLDRNALCKINDLSMVKNRQKNLRHFFLSLQITHIKGVSSYRIIYKGELDKIRLNSMVVNEKFSSRLKPTLPKK